MVEQAEFKEPGGALGRVVVVALVLLAVVAGYFLYTQLGDVRGVKVDTATPTMVDMLPPPPPPPPPPPDETPPPPEPTPSPSPSPSPEPAPAPDAPAPMTQAGPAQAGADAFGLQAGNGSGIGAPGGTGTCLSNCGPAGGIGEGFYRRALANQLQERIQADKRVSRMVFTAEFLITVSTAGRVTLVSLARSSGDGSRDAALKGILEAVQGLDAPPASVRFPQRITVRGRRSL